MNVYTDYNYYLSKYHGSLENSLFKSLVIKASKIIDRNVNKVLIDEDITEKVKYVTCELIDLLYTKNLNDSNNVDSISIDGVKKDFKTMSSSDFEDKKRDILSDLPHELTRYL